MQFFDDPRSTLEKWRKDRRYNIGATAIQEIESSIQNLSSVEQAIFLKTLDDFLLNGSWDNEGYYLDNRRETEKTSVKRQKRLEQSRLYRKVLREQNWCPSTVELLLKTTNIPGLSLGALLIDNATRQWHDQKHDKTESTHAKCTVRVCKALHVPERLQETALHTNECLERLGPGEPCKPASVNQDELLGILSMPSNPIPLVRLPLDDKKPGDQFPLVKRDASQPTPFIAISYVWQQRRLMPWCQLSHVAQKVREYTELKKLKAGNRNEYEVWLDVLCIPKHSDNEDDNKKRKRAMGNMQNVYGQANEVLVFDEVLENASKKETATAIGIKVLACDWMRRLWTMQEAMVSSESLVFVMSDGFLSYQELQRNLFRAQSAEKKGNCNFSTMVWSALLPLDAIRAERSSDDVQRWRSLLSALEFRSTSRKEDEPLCMASVLLWGDRSQPEWDRIPARSNQAEEHIYRMKELFLTLRSFPLSVIFCGGRRVNRTKYKNFGWMPESYIGRTSERRMNVQTRTGNPNIIAKCTEEGMEFRSDGDIFMLSPPTAGTVHGTIHLRLYEDVTGDMVLKRFAKSQWEINDEQIQVDASTDGNDDSVDDGWQGLSIPSDGRPLALITNDASHHDGMVVLVESWVGSKIVANFICQVFVGPDLDKERSDLLSIDSKEADYMEDRIIWPRMKSKQSLELVQTSSKRRNNQLKPGKSADTTGSASNWRSQQSRRSRNLNSDWRSQQSGTLRDLHSDWRSQQQPDHTPPDPVTTTASSSHAKSAVIEPPELSPHRQWVHQLFQDGLPAEDNTEGQHWQPRMGVSAHSTGYCLREIEWLIR